MASTDGKHLDMSGASNAMYDGIGRPFIFSCRTNGALVWDQLRASHGLKKDEYSTGGKSLEENSSRTIYGVLAAQGRILPCFRQLRNHPDNSFAPELGPDYSGLIETTLGTVYLYSKTFAKESAEAFICHRRR